MHNHVSLLQRRFQRLETSRHHIVLDLEKVKPSFLKKKMRRNFQSWVCFAVATLSHWCCLTHNMPLSAPTKQRWLRTSVPRVFEDTSTGKWRLRLLYTRARGQKPGRKQSIWFTSRADAENAADSWRRSYIQHTNSDVHTQYVDFALWTHLFHGGVSLGKHGCFRVSFGWMWSVFCLQQKQEKSDEILRRFERNWCLQRFAHTQRKSHVFLMEF